ncbi:uncharacterized protein [Rutidosis leptorrhynchoides]|uniref:uncharacterized protein n=1 Tax=Rutidosis leptorrhynchoides TaxID=125765 RepID=UPI003A98F48B
MTICRGVFSFDNGWCLTQNIQLKCNIILYKYITTQAGGVVLFVNGQRPSNGVISKSNVHYKELVEGANDVYLDVFEPNDDNVTFTVRLDRLKKEKKKEELLAKRRGELKDERPKPVLIGRNGRCYCDCEDPSCDGFCMAWYVLNKDVSRCILSDVNLRSRKKTNEVFTY